MQRAEDSHEMRVEKAIQREDREKRGTGPSLEALSDL